MNYSDSEIMAYIDKIMNKIKQNKQLQTLAVDNGIDIKNSIHLSDATEENVAISTIALLLAKRNNDPKYEDLVRFGMNHRTTKVDIINEYKAQASQMLAKYRQQKKDSIDTI